MQELTFFFHRTPFVDISKYDFDVEQLKLIPKEIMEEYRFVILDVFQNGFTLGMVEPQFREFIQSIFNKHFQKRIHLGVYKVHEEHLQPMLALV